MLLNNIEQVSGSKQKNRIINGSASEEWGILGYEWGMFRAQRGHAWGIGVAAQEVDYQMKSFPECLKPTFFHWFWGFLIFHLWINVSAGFAFVIIGCPSDFRLNC